MGGLRFEVDLKLSQVASKRCSLHSYFLFMRQNFDFGVLSVTRCTESRASSTVSILLKGREHFSE